MYQDYTMADVNNTPKNGLNVFSTFSCGGGSCLGYKLAGFNIKAICEIDGKLIKNYKNNFHVDHIFNQDIRELLAQDLPQELYDIDVLDGSPPCSVFSIAGNREKDWGKKKKFREGQKEQTLDDLFMVFIKLAEKIKPKVVISENVKGLMSGNAKGYVVEIVNAFDKAGYDTQIFLLNASFLGVPQRRERVFFISRRKDLNLPLIDLKYPLVKTITFDQIKTNTGVVQPLNDFMKKLIDYKEITDKNLSDVAQRVYKKNSYFNHTFLKDNEVPPTMASSSSFIVYTENRQASSDELIRIQSFPIDYKFASNSYTAIKYLLGMSVPPKMMEFVASRVAKQFFNKGTE